jgi:hypothetical protein
MSRAKVNSIREITESDANSSDGGIHGDTLLATVLEVAMHLNERERI